MTNMNNYCVIMGGGIGSRFWPFSRKTLPKQFLDFFGTGRSLLQQTFDRFQKVIPTENIFIVTNAMYADLVKEQLPEVNEDQILLEPARRNTAPCIAWASYHIRALNPNANIVARPSSDHLILKEDEFLAAIEKGLNFVSRSEKLLTFRYQAESSRDRVWIYTNRRTCRRKFLQSENIHRKAGAGISPGICRKWRVLLEFRSIYVERKYNHQSLRISAT